MTQALYHQDAYLKNFNATITQVNAEKNAVVLDASAFYPGGGGQPCDTGSLIFADQTRQVSRVLKSQGSQLHVIDGTLPEVGTPVEGVLNWERRYQLMRTHSAMHVLCGVIWRDYSAQVTGGNMEPLSGRMDFEFEHMSRDLVTEIEEKVNLELSMKRPVKTKTLPRQEAEQIPDLIRTKINLLPPFLKEIRTVEIVGLDLQADGGTHVSNISEVGKIQIVDYQSKGKINKRIKIKLLDM